jgi:hydroxyethylthiazole kinase-like uncharacterized protein yjeF
MVRGAENIDGLESIVQGADVLVLGTGLGRSAWSTSMLRIMDRFEGSILLDADALNLLAAEGSLECLHGSGRGVIMTPHPAEAARLLQVKTGQVHCDRVGAAQELADRSGAIVVLKGCGTVVAEPGGRYSICPLGNPGMASAGTGDVLAGVIGAMLAQGLGTWEAATAGVVAHAAAGDRAASAVGERGLIASDIIRWLPAVLNPA